MLSKKVIERITHKVPKNSIERAKEVKSLFSQEEIKNIFNYSQDGNLYWRISPASHVRIGDKASHVAYRGEKHNVFKRTCFKGKCYVTAKLIFFMFHGWMPEYVSYYDGDPLNTKIFNLRSATSSQINFSRKLKNKGVYFDIDKRKWKVKIHFKKTYYLGYYWSKEEAQEVYNLAAKRLCKDFVNVV
jgi:hypothetical protein